MGEEFWGRTPPVGPPARNGSVAVARALCGAQDEQLMRVVALVDGLSSNRGAADRLLESVRPRLAALRPPRPLSFNRLLFQPLDPVIVPTAEWRPGDARLPRGAITPLGAALYAALGAVAAAVETGCAGRTTDDAEAIRTLGALLWPAAAAALPRLAAPPAGWEASGLPASGFLGVTALCAEAWRRGGPESRGRHPPR